MSSYEIKVNEYGFYEIHWLDGRRTKRRSLRTKDPQMAYSRASYYLEQEKVERANLHDPNVKILINYYMENRGPEVTDAERLVYINRHLLAHFANLKPQRITPDVVRAYITKRRSGEIGKKGAGDGTIRRDLGHLVACINFGAKNGLVKREHIPFIQLPEQPAPKDRWLSKEEITKLIEMAKGRGRVELFFHIALRTAARKTSILELRWDQVDFQQGLIDYGKHDPKVRKKKRRPTVPISDQLRPILEEAHRRRHNEYVLGHPGSVRTAFENLMNQAGMPDVTPHTLRHTWATHASMSGVPMNEIARVLGDTLATVEKVYAKFAPSYLRGAINAVNF